MDGMGVGGTLLGIVILGLALLSGFFVKRR